MADTLRIRMLLEAGDRFTRPLRDLAGGSSKAAQNIKQMRDRLREVDRAQKDMAAFRELKTGLRSSGSALDEARAKVTKLGRELANTEAPTRKMTRAFETAKKEAAGLERQHGENSRRLNELRERLSAGGIATTSLARHDRELRGEASRLNSELAEQSRRLAEVTERSRRLSAARAGFDRMQARATGLAVGGAAAIGTGVALGRPLASAEGDAREFESRMTDIAQKADNLGRTGAARLGSQLIVAARAANQLPSAIQDGVDALTGMGASVPDAARMMTPIGRAATAYKATIEDLSRAAYATKDNLAVPVTETGRAIDIMAAAGKRGAFEMKDMAQHFPELSASMQGLKSTGVPAVADLAAALQITRKGAGDSASAANNLQNLLAKINTKDTIDNFKKFGVDVPAAMKKAAAEGRSPIEEIIELTRRATGGDTAKLAFLFGDMQVQQALRPLLANTQLYRQIRAEALAARGVTDGDFAERMNDADQKARRLVVSAAALKLTIGNQLAPAFAIARTHLANFADRMNAFSQRHPMFAKGAALVAAGLAALFVVFGVGAIAVAGIMGPIAILNAGLIAMGVAGGVASIGLLPIIGTVAAVVAGVVALGAGAYLIYSKWGAISGFFGNLWNGIQTRFAAAAAAVKTVFQGMWNGVKAIFSLGAIDVYKGIAYFAGYALGALFRFGSAAFGWLSGTLPGMLASGWNAAWATLTGAITGSWAWLTTRLPVMLANGWNVAWSAFKGAMYAAFVTLPAMFFDFGLMIVKGLWNGIKSAPARLWNAGKSLAASVTGGFKAGAGIRSPSRVFMKLGGHIMSGLTLGLAANERGPLGRITRLSKNMAAGLAVPAIAAGAALPAIPARAAAEPMVRLGQLSRDVAAAITVAPAKPSIAAPAAGSARAQMPAPAAAAGGDRYEIHLHAAPGMDEATLVRLLERRLAEIDRAKAARGRSSFADQPDWG